PPRSRFIYRPRPQLRLAPFVTPRPLVFIAAIVVLWLTWLASAQWSGWQLRSAASSARNRSVLESSLPNDFRVLPVPTLGPLIDSAEPMKRSDLPLAANLARGLRSIWQSPPVLTRCSDA